MISVFPMKIEEIDDVSPLKTIDEIAKRPADDERQSRRELVITG